MLNLIAALHLIDRAHSHALTLDLQISPEIHTYLSEFDDYDVKCKIRSQPNMPSDASKRIFKYINNILQLPVTK